MLFSYILIMHGLKSTGIFRTVDKGSKSESTILNVTYDLSA